MTNDPPETPDHDTPTARVERTPRRFSFAWFVPLGAIILAAVLAFQAMREKGVTITIAFPEAHGLAADDAVLYRGLRIGEVTDIRLAPDLEGVVVEARIRRDAAVVAVEGARFWIVRPEISLRKISGLDTLLGSRYIALDPGPASAPPARVFVGLNEGPLVGTAPPGALAIRVNATRRNAVSVGSPVFYRDVVVGRVRSYALADDATGVMIDLEIDPPYTALVREKSRFWNVSGFGVDFGIFSGFSVQADSLEAVITGGIAFATPSNKRMGDPVTQGHIFELAEKPDEDWLKWHPTISIAPTGDQ